MQNIFSEGGYNTSFNAYVSKFQVVTDKHTLDTLKKHSETLGMVRTAIDMGLSVDDIANIIDRGVEV